MEGEPATEPTDVWVFFDNSMLYLAARCWDSHPERMVVNELRHDSSNLIGNESIAFILDTFHDKRNGFLFLMNALGGMLEESFVDESMITGEPVPVEKIADAEEDILQARTDAARTKAVAALDTLKALRAAL